MTTQPRVKRSVTLGIFKSKLASPVGAAQALSSVGSLADRIWKAEKTLYRPSGARLSFLRFPRVTLRSTLG